jgi:hypothetical protein
VAPSEGDNLGARRINGVVDLATVWILLQQRMIRDMPLSGFKRLHELSVEVEEEGIIIDLAWRTRPRGSDFVARWRIFKNRLQIRFMCSDWRNGGVGVVHFIRAYVRDNAEECGGQRRDYILWRFPRSGKWGWPIRRHTSRVACTLRTTRSPATRGTNLVRGAPISSP